MSACVYLFVYSLQTHESYLYRGLLRPENLLLDEYVQMVIVVGLLKRGRLGGRACILVCNGRELAPHM